MAGKGNYFRNSRASRADSRQGSVFVAAILVFAVVGVALFFGGSWGIVPTISSANLASAANARSVVTRPPTEVPTPVIPAMRPNAAILAAAVLPLPTATAIATAVATSTVVPPSATIQAASPLGPLVGHVGNTGGDGVFLRRSPRLADHWTIWADNTPLILLGNEADGDGQHWLQVRDPKDEVGWVPAQYVIR